LESLYKQHEEAISKLQQENTSLELGIQSRNELIGEIAAEIGLDRMGEDDNEDDNDEDDDKGDVVDDTIAAAPEDVMDEGNAAEEEEDP
jgi:hypothetical protein